MPPRRPHAVASAVALLSALAVTAEAQTVTRGPYLQLATPTSIVVRWRTDVATDSRVVFGVAPGPLDGTATDPAPTTEHAVALTGLAPATRYRYAVGSTTALLAGGDAAHELATPPARGADVPVRAWVVGDSGTANANAAAVRDAFLAFSADHPADLWLMLGDNAYTHGTDAQYQAAVFDLFAGILRTTVPWPVLGNHDALSVDTETESGPYFSIFDLPAAGETGGVPSGTERYYSFDHGPIHFVAIDTAIERLSPDGPLATWLATDLEASRQPWKVAFGHHPPYSKGSHDSDDPLDSNGRLVAMRESVVPVLEAAGVDLVLVGHSHAYERSVLLAGHWDYSWALEPAMVLDGGDGDPAGDGAYSKPVGGAGTVYVVAGSSGAVGPGALDHPVMIRVAASLGSLVLDVDGDRLDGRFLDDGGVVRDHFAIVKVWRLFRDGFESGDLSAWSSSAGS